MSTKKILTIFPDNNNNKIATVVVVEIPISSRRTGKEKKSIFDTGQRPAECPAPRGLIYMRPPLFEHAVLRSLALSRCKVNVQTAG
jgi:hypothetical protein